MLILSAIEISSSIEDIGGLDKQIQELIEAVVLPMTRSELFESIGIKVDGRNAWHTAVNSEISHPNDAFIKQ